ncbi:hypothetical protein NPX13_g3367 [Xylaria arbuscula]|uniref:Uncharacterized protein n=1 Tax=Xylaria arbuscula TaxID=114810 RepID=A0A9W8NI10_9PEZI|nr:hypothetical protein NPX13_g3367 [Xylaria arbuscula]
MDSPELEKFHKCWSARYILMKTQHDEELASLEGRAQKERQHAKKDAEDKLRDLRNNPPTKLAELSDQDRKIKDQRDAALKSIDEHYAQRMCIVKKSQLAEEENYNQGYAQAQANRSLVDSAPPDNHASVDTPMADVMSVTTLAESKDVPETRHCEGVNNSTAGPTDQELPDPSNNQVLSVESAVSTPAALPEQRSESVLPERGFSATVQREFAADGSEHRKPSTRHPIPMQ